MNSETISCKDFFELPEVVAQIEIQKANKFGSEAHRNAYIKYLEIGASHGVSQHLGTLEEYDS